MNPADFAELAPGALVTSAQGHTCFVPAPLPPQLSLGMSTIHTLARAERALGKLAGAGEMLPCPHLLIGPFVRRETVLSSRLKGPSLTRKTWCTKRRPGRPPRHRLA